MSFTGPGKAIRMREASCVRDIPEEDQCRAHFYGMLASVLAAPPRADQLAGLAQLTGSGAARDDTAMGRALAALADRAAQMSPAAADAEFSKLFVGLTEGELRPYASYYLAGCLFEKPLARLREDMERLRIGRTDGVCEPEDHIAALLEMMQGLILGVFGDPATLSTQRAFLDAHVFNWTPRFFADLEAAAGAGLYGPVGAVGGTFMAIEREAFDLLG